MSHRNALLLTLQGNCKRDPEGYRADFMVQRDHFYALLELCAMHPDQKSGELCDMVLFFAHVSRSYPEELSSLPKELMNLLTKDAAKLQPQLRTQIVQALILMRRKGIVGAEELLPVCFQLFQCQDKQLRALVHAFVINDIKGFNSGGRNDRLNRRVQNYLYQLIASGGDASVKRALAVVTELWRRQIWRDARTVNVIAAAADHESSSITLAACKFFLGQDVAREEDEDPNEDDSAPLAPSKDDVYRAYNKGTPTTKKKKVRKLKRVMSTIEKHKKRGKANTQDSFAAMQLLHDPQTFAERLFARCSQKQSRFDTRVVMLQVISRAIGVHELVIENFYPFVQRYLQPSQREIVAMLAVMVQACHKLVPPDLLRPVLKQLVDQFVHDKARPEVVTVGLKTVREMCVRCPLVMDEELLSDLALYGQDRDKHVKSAAKALVALFRELKPSMLEKKHRGRAADMALELAEFGAAELRDRVDGAELLQKAEEAGDSRDEEVSFDETPSQEESEARSSSDATASDLDSQGRASNPGSASGESDRAESPGDGAESAPTSSRTHDSSEDVCVAGVAPSDTDASLAELKRQLATARASQAQPDLGPSHCVADDATPLEYDRILTQEDFERIRRLKVKQMVEHALQKHGLKSAQQRARLKDQLYEEMEEALDEQEARETAKQQRLDPTALLGKRRGRADKAERMASVMAGREGRDAFGSSVSRKKQKTGGTSNRQKEKRKHVLLGATKVQAANRRRKQRQKRNPKNFRGRASLGAWDK